MHDFQSLQRSHSEIPWNSSCIAHHLNEALILTIVAQEEHLPTTILFFFFSSSSFFTFHTAMQLQVVPLSTKFDCFEGNRGPSSYAGVKGI